MITVYMSGVACMQCRLTKQVMDAEGIAHTDIDLGVMSR